MKYRRKPVDIEAVQFTRDSIEECKKFITTAFSDILLANIIIPRCLDGIMIGEIVTLDERDWVCTLAENDFIVKDSKGSVYNYNPRFFKANYERIEE